MRLSCHTRHKEVGTQSVENMVDGLAAHISMASLVSSTKVCHSIGRRSGFISAILKDV